MTTEPFGGPPGSDENRLFRGKGLKERPSSERGGLVEARERKKVVTRAVRSKAKRRMRDTTHVKSELSMAQMKSKDSIWSSNFKN